MMNGTEYDADPAAQLFDQFISAVTCKSILGTFHDLCDSLGLTNTDHRNFYKQLKSKLTSWKAKSLWTKLDKRASHRDYRKMEACPNTKVLIIGAGPCGMRMAIEVALMGGKAVVVEKRDRFSRNNVLHLWNYLISDLKNLGAKKFFGKFCAGSIEHISIRQLQCILMKVALLLGVEVHVNVAFEELIEPPEDQSSPMGWRCRVTPSNHPVSEYQFDVLIGADGKRNTVPGFKRKEFRGKLAIAITANFINRNSNAEARVEEISGVAFIFNQKFFLDLKEKTSIDLENIVYYKDETHYFVMTAKKASLLEKGVLKEDYNDTVQLLSRENVDQDALLTYAKEAADFSTNHQLPCLDYAVNHYGQADIAMFDFTSMFAAENACRALERHGHKLAIAIVGDSLLEPFWPTGSGCARGFLGVFDAAWMIKSWASGKMSPLEVIAERESIYQLLSQTTPENLHKNHGQYSIDPNTRYPNLNLKNRLKLAQVKHLYDGPLDNLLIEEAVDDAGPAKRSRICGTTVNNDLIDSYSLLRWCQRVLNTGRFRNVHVVDFAGSWRNGLAFCALIHAFRPTLLDFNLLMESDVAKNNQLAFDVAEKDLGVPPVMTGEDMAKSQIPDKLTLVSYISQLYAIFRKEPLPTVDANLIFCQQTGCYVRKAEPEDGEVSTIKVEDNPFYGVRLAAVRTSNQSTPAMLRSDSQLSYDRPGIPDWVRYAASQASASEGSSVSDTDSDSTAADGSITVWKKRGRRKTCSSGNSDDEVKRPADKTFVKDWVKTSSRRWSDSSDYTSTDDEQNRPISVKALAKFYDGPRGYSVSHRPRSKKVSAKREVKPECVETSSDVLANLSETQIGNGAVILDDSAFKTFTQDDMDQSNPQFTMDGTVLTGDDLFRTLTQGDDLKVGADDDPSDPAPFPLKEAKPGDISVTRTEEDVREAKTESAVQSLDTDLLKEECSGDDKALKRHVDVDMQEAKIDSDPATLASPWDDSSCKEECSGEILALTKEATSDVDMRETRTDCDPSSVAPLPRVNLLKEEDVEARTKSSEDEKMAAVDMKGGMRRFAGDDSAPPEDEEDADVDSSDEETVVPLDFKSLKKKFSGDASRTPEETLRGKRRAKSGSQQPDVRRQVKSVVPRYRHSYTGGKVPLPGPASSSESSTDEAIDMASAKEALKQEKYPGSEFKGPGATQATESLSSTSNTSSTDTVLENTDVDMEHKSDHVESASIDFRASKRKFLEAAGKESKKVDRRSSFRSPQYPQGNSYMDRLKESHPWAADKMALGHGESHPQAADKMALGHGESHPWAADKKALGHGESHPQAADMMALGHGESHPWAADKMALRHGERKEVCIKGDREESKGHKGKEVHMVGGGSETPERRVEAESDTQPDDAGDERKLEFIIPGEYRSQGGVHFDGTFSQLETESSTDIVVPVTEDSVAEIDALESQEPCVKQRNDEGENTGSKTDACDDDTEDKFYDAVELSTQDKNNTLTDATLCEALYQTAYEAPPDDSGVSDKDNTLTDATLCEALYQTAYEPPPDDSGVSDKDNTLTDATLCEALYQTAYEPPPDDSGVSKFSRDILYNDDDEVFATAVGTQLASRLNHVSVSEDMDC